MSTEGKSLVAWQFEVDGVPKEVIKEVVSSSYSFAYDRSGDSSQLIYATYHGDHEEIVRLHFIENKYVELFATAMYNEFITKFIESSVPLDKLDTKIKTKRVNEWLLLD